MYNSDYVIIKHTPQENTSCIQESIYFTSKISPHFHNGRNFFDLVQITFLIMLILMQEKPWCKYRRDLFNSMINTAQSRTILESNLADKSYPQVF